MEEAERNVRQSTLKAIHSIKKMIVSESCQTYLTDFSHPVSTPQTGFNTVFPQLKYNASMMFKDKIASGWPQIPPTCLCSPAAAGLIDLWPLVCLQGLIMHLTTVSICLSVCLPDSYTHTFLSPVAPSNLTLSQLPFIISGSICCLSSPVTATPILLLLHNLPPLLICKRSVCFTSLCL